MGGSTPVESRDIVLAAPDISENGAPIQVGLSAALPGIRPAPRQRRQAHPGLAHQRSDRRHNGKTVLTVMCGPSVSRDPYLQFMLKGAKPGDKVAISWKDNRGATRSGETTVI